MRRSIVVVGSLLLLPTMLQAQGHGGMAGGGMAMGHAMAMGHPMVAAPHAMGHVGAVGAPIRVSGGTRMVPRAGSSRLRVGPGPVRVTRRPRSTSPGTAFNRPFNFNNDDEFDAPGLGFDETHFRNTHPRRFDRDRDRFRFRNDFATFFPFFDGGFFLPSAPFIDDTGVDVPPEDIAAEEAPEPPHARTHYREQYEPPVVSREAPAEPAAKTEEYVFVRRDGTLFFAVAYTWDHGTLRYITSEGMRRSATSDTLDLDATQHFNEQRGMTFHFPA